MSLRPSTTLEELLRRSTSLLEWHGVEVNLEETPARKLYPHEVAQEAMRLADSRGECRRAGTPCFDPRVPVDQACDNCRHARLLVAMARAPSPQGQGKENFFGGSDRPPLEPQDDQKSK